MDTVSFDAVEEVPPSSLSGLGVDVPASFSIRLLRICDLIISDRMRASTLF